LQYLKKGVKLFVRGRQRTSIFTASNGENRISININASEVNVCNFGNEKPKETQVKPQKLEQITPEDLPF